MYPYENKSSYPKVNAQSNLQGRTHYVDDDTLRFHKSRILQTHITDQGLLFALIESCAADMHNRRRVFRPVIFDIFGHVIERPKLEDGYSTRKLAEKRMWEALNGLDAAAITRAAVKREREYHAMEMQRVSDLIGNKS